MIIRQIKDTDLDIVYDLIKEAFKTAEVSSGTEQDFTLKLRKSSNYIPELELIAEENEKIIGQIMFTKQKLEDSSFDEGLLLAPLCVREDKRHLGIGSKLVKKGFELAAKQGYKAVFLVGNPEYYKKFGFDCITKFDIELANDFPSQFAMVHELYSGALKNIKGKIKFAEE